MSDEMNALLTIKAPLGKCHVEVRVDLLKHETGVYIPPEFGNNVPLVSFDVRHVEPGEAESVVISSIEDSQLAHGIGDLEFRQHNSGMHKRRQ